MKAKLAAIKFVMYYIVATSILITVVTFDLSAFYRPDLWDREGRFVYMVGFITSAYLGYARESN